jgi:hypothetical protein
MKRAKIPTFLIELPLRVDWSQERPLRAHLEAARCLYNALLSEANKRLHQMRHDPAWAEARAIPRTKKQERAQAFSHLRKKHHFSEYELHEYAKGARICWIADHIDSTMAQTLATRAYQAVNRVCVGKARRVRFKSRGRGIDSVEGKRNDVGMRFFFDPNAGDGGFLVWNEQVIPAIINWLDPVIQHGLRHPIKYVRLVRRRASSPQAQGADGAGNRYCVQVVLEGHAFTGASRSTATPACAGRRASGTKQPGGSTLPRREDWQPTARACMANWLIRSLRWATRSISKRPHSKDGRNSMVGASDFAHQGCLERI